MANIIVFLVIVLIVGGALFYICREKKKGVRCVGCPYAGSCTSGTCKGKN